MERSDDVLVEALGAEAAERVRQIEKVLSHRLAGLGRVVPVGEPPELPPPLVEEPEPEAEEPAAALPAWRIPEDRELTRRELNEQKRQMFPDFCDVGPPSGSLMRKRF